MDHKNKNKSYIYSKIESKIDIVPQFEDKIWESADKASKNMRKDMEDVMFCINFMKKLLKSLKLNNTNNIITFIISNNEVMINNKYIDYDIFLKFNNFLYKHTNVDLINQSDNKKTMLELYTMLELDSYIKLFNTLQMKFDELNDSVQKIYESGAKKVSNILDVKNAMLASLDKKAEKLIEICNDLLDENNDFLNKNFI